MNIPPVRPQIYRDAYRATLAKTGGDAAAAHQAGVEAVERAVAFYNQRDAEEEAAKTAALVDPKTRPGLYDADPQLRERLAGEVGWTGWARRAHDAKTAEGGPAWDSVVLNEFLALRGGATDPRVEMVQLAERLAAENRISFTAAIEAVKMQEPELVEQIVRFNEGGI